jgi:hypothetical protein
MKPDPSDDARLVEQEKPLALGMSTRELAEYTAAFAEFAPHCPVCGYIPQTECTACGLAA